MGKQIAEGGFSYVFEAFPVDDTNNNNNQSDNPRSRVAVRERNNELKLYIMRVAKWQKIINFWGGKEKHKQTDLFKLYSI